MKKQLFSILIIVAFFSFNLMGCSSKKATPTNPTIIKEIKISEVEAERKRGLVLMSKHGELNKKRKELQKKNLLSRSTQEKIMLTGFDLITLQATILFELGIQGIALAAENYHMIDLTDFREANDEYEEKLKELEELLNAVTKE